MPTLAPDAPCEIRYGTVDGEQTACLLVGLAGEGAGELAEERVVVALPFQSALHQGSWQAFEVTTPQGQTVKLRMTTIPKESRKGLRRKPMKSWSQEDFADFEVDVAGVTTQQLWDTYSGQQHLPDMLNQSQVEMLPEEVAEVEVAPPSIALPEQVAGPGQPPLLAPQPSQLGLPPALGPPETASSSASQRQSLFQSSTSPSTPLTTTSSPPGWNVVEDLSAIPKISSSEGEVTKAKLPDWLQPVVADLGNLKSQHHHEQIARKSLAEDVKKEFANVEQKTVIQHQAFQAFSGEMLTAIKELKGAVTSLKEGQAAAGSALPRKAPRVEEEEDDLRLPNLKEQMKGRRRVAFAEPQEAASGTASTERNYAAPETAKPPWETGADQQPEFFSTLLTTLNNQNQVLAKLATARPGGEELDPILSAGAAGDVSFLRSSREREAWMKQIIEKPDSVVDCYHRHIRAEGRAQEHEVFTTVNYGECCLAPEWVGHSTFHRFWIMMSDIECTLSEGKYKVGHAKLCQCMKAVAIATKNKGKWDPAWEYTYLPKPNEAKGGVSVEEEASVGRTLRDRAAVEKSIKDSSS